MELLFVTEIAVYNIEKQEIRKAQLKETLLRETIPYYLARFDSITAANDGYLAIGRLTWADFYFVSLLDYCNGVMKKDLIEGYENLIKLRDKITSLPAIKKWITERPQSEY